MTSNPGRRPRGWADSGAASDSSASRSDDSLPSAADDDKIADLTEAIRAGEISPWYQPIVELSTGKIIGLEALARRLHPDGRIDPPGAFVPIAERSELIVDLDAAVAKIALDDLNRWHLRYPALSMNLNLSGRHLDQDEWVTGIVDLAASSGVSPTTVRLEITETVRPTLSTSGIARIQLARSLGFSLWLDDFGSGWSGWRDLLHLSLDGVKIDQSFADALGTRVGQVLVSALTTAASELGLNVTLEGIERPEQATLAKSLGCQFGQGFFWSEPVPALDIDRLLN